MTPMRFTWLILIASSSLVYAGQGAPTAPPAAWTATGNLETPESAFVDPDTGVVFVSLIVGGVGARDGNGRIAKLSLDGKVIASDWVTGLNAPKGLRAFKGTLWTADLDELIGIEIASGRISSRVKVSDAKFLNDVDVSADGTVYTSDTLLNRIYAVKDGNSSIFAEGADLESPNGLLIDGNRLIVGTMGTGGGADAKPGRVLAIDLKTKVKTPLTAPIGAIDGIERDGRGGYIVTDTRASKVLQITPTGEVRQLLQLSGGAADLAVVVARKLAIVPLLRENKVAAYDISAAWK
jgi:hypothetical protein